MLLMTGEDDVEIVLFDERESSKGVCLGYLPVLTDGGDSRPGVEGGRHVGSL